MFDAFRWIKAVASFAPMEDLVKWWSRDYSSPFFLTFLFDLFEMRKPKCQLTAYGSRCAISRLPEPRLLDAAHIVMDANEQLGQPITTNGLPLSKIHHAAFDADLIGIDPDFRIHVSEGLLEMHDGPFLELGLKAMPGSLIQLPRRPEDYPDRDRRRRCCKT